MARVPTLDNFSVAPDRLPGVTVQPVTSRVDPGAQLGRLSQTVERAGAVAMGIENDALLRANQLRVDDALNRALEAEMRLTYDQEAGFTSQKGLSALERQSGKPLADEYTEAFGKEVEGIASGLGNDWQKQAFNQAAAKRAASFRASAMRHESQEFQTYTLSVREGTIANRMDFIGRNYNNIEAIDESITSIRAATYDIARVQGKSAEWAEAQARKMTSNAHKVALGTAIEKNDITFADDYLKKYAGQMDADDLLQARGLITKEMDLRVGVEAATAVMGKVAPRIVTSEFDRLVNITMASESGGRRYGSDGVLLASAKGARGEMQVMDDTNRDPGFGVRAAQDGSPDERARVGRDYLAAMMQKYGGDPAKAWAAYNAGPGTLDKALRTAEAMARNAARNPELGAKDWLDLMPAETREYVAKNLKAYGAGQGSHARPTPAEIEAQLAADPQLAGNPARLAAARAEAKRQYDAIDASIKQREEEGTATALRTLLENGGNFAALTATQRAMIPAEKLSTVMEFGAKVRKGDDHTSLWLYNKMESNPAALSGMSDDAFFALRAELSDADFKHFANERAKLMGRSASGANSPDEMNTAAIRDGLDQRLRMLGLDPTPKDGTNDAERIGGIRQFVNTYIATAQREAGKKFADVEVAQQLDTLFAKNANFRQMTLTNPASWFGMNNPMSGPMLTMKIGDLSGDAKQRIRDAYKRQGVDEPTDAQILQAYWTAQSTRR